MVEIERKFLIDTKLWKPAGTGIKIKQGYLSVDKERVVRVRIADEKAFLTIKGNQQGIVRTEFEYEIPKSDAEVLLKMCRDFVIGKSRFKERIGNLIWEIDIFEGKNFGLVMAEVELKEVNQNVILPPWIGEEVSLDYRYFNSSLSVKPYLYW